MAKGRKRKALRHDFETVDGKVAEAEFFLRKMAKAGADFFAFNCYFSAYLSASRTTTLALQQFKHIPGFEEWYRPHRESLKADPLAKFFLGARNDHVHGGPHPVTGAVFHQHEAQYYFDQVIEVPGGRSRDVLSVCRNYFVMLLAVVHDCYVKLGVHIDPQQYYSKEYFITLGRNIDDAEIEVWGWVCTSLIEEGCDEDDRWHELRGHVGECMINHLFYAYLGSPTPQPILPEHIQDFDFSPEDRGWIHIPAGFSSMDEYRIDRRKYEEPDLKMDHRE